MQDNEASLFLPGTTIALTRATTTDGKREHMQALFEALTPDNVDIVYEVLYSTLLQRVRGGDGEPPR